MDYKRLTQSGMFKGFLAALALKAIIIFGIYVLPEVVRMLVRDARLEIIQFPFAFLGIVDLFLLTYLWFLGPLLLIVTFILERKSYQYDERLRTLLYFVAWYLILNLITVPIAVLQFGKSLRGIT